MPSQLYKNDNISFVVARRFSSRGKDYEVGDDFPQEDTDKIETFVRARYIIPVVDSLEDKKHIRHWHRHVRPKDEVLSRLARDRTQLVMPSPPDSDEVVNLNVLTHPEQTPVWEAGAADTGTGVGEDSGESGTPFDPGDHTVAEVKEYLEENPEETERVLAAEAAGRGRKGLVEE
jgi:hypothetical protein